MIQRAVARCSGPRLTSSHLAPILNLPAPVPRRLPEQLLGPTCPWESGLSRRRSRNPRKRIIIQALQAFNWNRQETARVLDINRTTLYKKMKKYGLLMDEPIWVKLNVWSARIAESVMDTRQRRAQSRKIGSRHIRFPTPPQSSRRSARRTSCRF